jgi:hypothetical protein
VLVAESARRTSPLSQVLLYRLDGAYAAVPENATAFAGTRVPQFGVFVAGFTGDAAALATEREWVRRTWAALQPFALGQKAYVNGQSEFDEARVRALYGEKYDRLAALKERYDPDNVFHRIAPITPVPRAGIS